MLMNFYGHPLPAFMIIITLSCLELCIKFPIYWSTLLTEKSFLGPDISENFLECTKGALLIFLFKLLCLNII